jgi:hypothetical protein
MRAELSTPSCRSGNPHHQRIADDATEWRDQLERLVLMRRELSQPELPPIARPPNLHKPAAKNQRLGLSAHPA